MTTSSKLNFRSCQPKHILTNRTVNLFQDRACVLPTLLIVVFATISAPAGILILSADILIVFPNAIRIFWGYPYSLYAPLLRNVSALLLKFHNLHLPFILDSSPNCIGTFLTHKYLYNSEMSLKECLLWVNYDIFS